MFRTFNDIVNLLNGQKRRTMPNHVHISIAAWDMKGKVGIVLIKTTHEEYWCFPGYCMVDGVRVDYPLTVDGINHKQEG